MRKLNDFSNEMAKPDYGKSFLRLPRKVLQRLYGKDDWEKQLGWLYITLIIHAFHSDGYVLLNGERVSCCRGEFVSSLRKLAELTKLSYSTIKRLLERLKLEQLVRLIPVKGGTRIQIIGYNEITYSQKRTGQPDIQLTAAQSMAAYEERLKRGFI